MNNHAKVRSIAQGGIIAALYVVLTLIANALGLANYEIQVRFSEALTILPFFTPAAIPGLFAGCLLSNILTGCAIWDIVFGSLATLIGAIGTWWISHKTKLPAMAKIYFSPLPPIIANVIVVPQVLSRVYMLPGTILYFSLTVGAGEVISCGILGLLLLFVLRKRNLLTDL